MTTLDEPDRKRLLTDIDTTILVEAAAGTGKTSVLAGRIAMLLVAGRPARQIAAITFTELAAAELRHRIHATVTALLEGQVPVVLKPVVGTGLTVRQSETLRAGALHLDELTTTTIHGFCQTLIRMHAVTAGLDPGSQVIDAEAADAMFAASFSYWLRARLSDPNRSGDDPIVIMARDAPQRVVGILQELAELRRKHPTATVSPLRGDRPDVELVAAVDAFARWYTGTRGERSTADLIAQLEQLAAFFAGALDGTRSFESLWHLIRPPHLACMKKPKADRPRYDLHPYQRKTAWERACGREDGGRWFDEALAHYDRVNDAYGRVMGSIAQSLMHTIAGALDGILDDYDQRKRQAAALDFDDLILKARALVADHAAVREAVGARFRSILVDEFQDTDPVQSEILFRIAGISAAENWTDTVLRPGALFMVGDPKQAIYRFRGADIEVYHLARRNIETLSNGAVITIAANFRSQQPIIDHVNTCFAPILNATGQPGYVALEATMEEDTFALPRVVKTTIEVPDQARSDEVRETEAAMVAEICERLIGSLAIRRSDGRKTLLRPGDIALLAPARTDLWRYERALEARRLTVASQAGKALMRRQETLDMLALMRTLANSRDMLAFGAFMRGPLVGLTDNELLDIAAVVDPDQQRFSILTSPDTVPHPLARDVLSILQAVRRRAHTTTPMMLLSEAIERLRVRVMLAARHRSKAARALSNIDALIERARGYGVRGLHAFVEELQRDWEASTPALEGRSDISQDAIELLTMHSAKGLEWPVVIPINTASEFRSPDQFVHRRADDTLHWVVGGVEPPDLAAARAEEAASESSQRARIWYVACTRARDLLILPTIPGRGGNNWARTVNLRHDEVPELDLQALHGIDLPAGEATTNQQTAERFAEEAAVVQAASPEITWRRPSDHDADRLTPIDVPGLSSLEVAEALAVGEIAGAGRIRGIVLHKLMEEFISGELEDDEAAAVKRAAVLLDEIEVAGLRQRPEPSELGATAHRTLHLPEIAALRPTLVAEVPIWGSDGDQYLAARGDALAINGADVTTVVDWKSDVDPTAEVHASYIKQVQDYCIASGAPLGAIVYMTRGTVYWVKAAEV